MRLIIYILILALFFALLCSCNTSKAKGTEEPVTGVFIGEVYTSRHIRIYKIFIDDCMYIGSDGYHELSLVHAGNCPNPIHNGK